ncbi:tRNA pseudouridine(38-40) synthase TruA [Methanohalophilus mahii]|uniref:tRNA pseudouridine synthase A n=1 Tax=Methanohalophilus mahii (strain ATCC 35705 / DSM 5219 / SLP) TaxID=547558 RepID=D5E8Q7_METMS|nr:tRNA pseudouridine(38-40) synthase TruA [Methanohalophilus mahii]ADE35566.1 tRNA pseudouridine synthase A [Methanohalophilus mahii DSM 5219]
MRVALKIAYIGSSYRGSQVQPGVSTIEGKIFEALQSLEIIEDPSSARFVSSGRTDTGVHAMGQVVAFDTDKPKLAIPRVINSKLPGDIWAWSRAEVDSDFHPRRYAINRTYRYITPSMDADISKLRAACSILEGSHDFANFCFRDTGRSTIRRIEKIDVRLAGNLLRIDITANSFLWKMIRKIVTVLLLVGSGARDLDWLENMLDPASYEEGIKPAKPYGLILTNVNYGDSVQWVDDGYSMRRSRERIEEYLVYHQVLAEVMDQFLPKEPKAE